MTRAELEENMGDSEPLIVNFEVIGDYIKFNVNGKEKVFSLDELENTLPEPCDCISRQQAIDKMQELEDEDDEMYGCSIPEGFDGKRAIEALKTLPSIQPKPKTDVLDKIRAEIEQYEADCRLQGGTDECEKCNSNVFGSVYRIIDKYKAESEDKR